MKLAQLWQRSLLWLLIFWCILGVIYHLRWPILGIGVLVWLGLLYFTARGVFWTYRKHLTFNRQKSEDFLIKAVRYQPLIPQPYLSLGVTYARGKRWPEAISVLQEALKITNANTNQDIQVMLAICYREHGEYQKALDILTKLIAQGSKSFTNYLNLALCYFKLGSFDESLEAARKARSYDVKNTQPVILMGRINFELKEFEKARDNYEWALKQISWPVETYYWLGRTEWELENKKVAGEYLEKAVERIKNDPELSDISFQEAEEWLGKVRSESFGGT